MSGASTSTASAAAATPDDHAPSDPGPAPSDPSSLDPLDPSQYPTLRVTFKQWTAVAAWKWITPNDETECGICRLPFNGCCPDCKFPGDDCALVSGQCRHSFHLHCIQKWLEAQHLQQQCPMCRQEWKFSE